MAITVSEASGTRQRGTCLARLRSDSESLGDQVEEVLASLVPGLGQAGDGLPGLGNMSLPEFEDPAGKIWAQGGAIDINRLHAQNSKDIP